MVCRSWAVSACFVRRGIRERGPPAQREATSRRRRIIQHSPCEPRAEPPVDDQERYVVASNDRISRVRDIDGHCQVPSLVEAQPHTLLGSREVVAQQPAKLCTCAFGDLNHQLPVARHARVCAGWLSRNPVICPPGGDAESRPSNTRSDQAAPRMARSPICRTSCR
jgi:hypothetical protein